MTRKEAKEIYLKVLDNKIQEAEKRNDKQEAKRLIDIYCIISDYENSLDLAENEKQLNVFID